MRDINFRSLTRTAKIPRFAASVAIAGCVGTPMFISGFISSAHAELPLNVTVQAQAQATQDVAITSPITDAAGVFSDSERASLEKKLDEAFDSSGVKLDVVFVKPNGSVKGMAKQLQQRYTADDALVMVVDVNANNVDMYGGSDVDKSAKEEVKKAVTGKRGQWAEIVNSSAQALIDDSSVSGSSLAWMAGAGVAVVGGGGAIYYTSRRNRKQTEAQQLDNARNIEPEATTDLAQQPIGVLRSLAEEELHSTDESIRKGEEELAVATDEFGEARTRDLKKAVNESKTTLNKAYGMHQRIKGGLVNSDAEERSILTDIVSSCGIADKNLNSQAEKFAALRQKLMNSSELLEKLVQASVSLRARIPGARAILEDLSTRVDPELLASIEHNPDIAEEEIDQVEKAIEKGRELAARPAGQQGGLIDLLGSARMAITQADSQLQAVENAETQLNEARTNLNALIEEVDGEIAEAQSLADSPAKFDREGLQEAVTEARAAMDKARTDGQRDPLGTYSALLAADGTLDIALDEARGADNNFRRTLDMVDRTIADVNQNLEAVENTIRNRRTIIGVDARSAVQGARSALDHALEQRDHDPKNAFLLAQNASELTSQASQFARRDIEDFNRRNQRPYGGGGGGNLVTGLVLGSLLSNNGGFGGGGFGGGGFSGGGGGDGDFFSL